jgi:lipoate-protein ligase A
MKLLERTFSSPEENLACDEALLDALEEASGGEVLRFWEPAQYFVVVGYTNNVASEVDIAACGARGIPVLRRCSGGGTVLQGPGCFNYSLVLRIDAAGPLATISGANAFIMERHRLAVQRLITETVTVGGYSDLAIRNRKFSGNAQRRRQRSLLYHGTFLIDFDILLVEAVLKSPSHQPQYRNNRPHEKFLTNLPLSRELLTGALCSAWNAAGQLTDLPQVKLDTLVQTRYTQPAWNQRR